MTELKAEGVTVRRGGRAIVDDISLTFPDAALVAVIGANGAGKSTLLTALAGLSRPDGGRVTLDGAPILGLKPVDLAKRRAFLPQSPRCDWPIAVERLVALGLTPVLPAFGGLPAEFAPRIEAALAAMDLIDHRDQPATTLSGGELARAMLARALVSDPAVLIADEPAAGLDPRHALDSLARLRALADQGRLVIASVHDLTLAARFATHLAVMAEGRLLAFGPTLQVLTPSLLRQAFHIETEMDCSEAGVFVKVLGVAVAA